MPMKLFLSLLIAGCLLIEPTLAAAQVGLPSTSRLTIIDRDFMDSQRASIDELARTGLARQIRGNKANDLDVLQQLLDRRLVAADEVLVLQAMGIVLGDLLSEELKMPWVVYEDKLGRSRALRLGLTKYYLFPVTMISRRAEVGAPVNVKAIYDKAVETMAPHLPPKPFQ